MLKTYKIIGEKSIALEYGEQRLVVSRIKRYKENNPLLNFDYSYTVQIEININYNASENNWQSIAACDIENNGVMAYLDDVIMRLKAIEMKDCSEHNYTDYYFGNNKSHNKERIHVFNLKWANGLEHFRFIKYYIPVFNEVKEDAILIKYDIQIGLSTDYLTCEYGFFISDISEDELGVIQTFKALFENMAN